MGLAQAGDNGGRWMVATSRGEASNVRRIRKLSQCLVLRWVDRKHVAQLADLKFSKKFRRRVNNGDRGLRGYSSTQRLHEIGDRGRIPRRRRRALKQDFNGQMLVVLPVRPMLQRVGEASPGCHLSTEFERRF
jgi:hypothetical protein